VSQVNRGRSRSTSGPSSSASTDQAVHSITSAAQAHSDDLDARIRRYLFSMGLRTACVLLVFVVHSPVRWVFAVLAVILPYVAVVMANAAGGRRRPAPGPVPMVALPIPENGSGQDFSVKPDVISDASSERTN